MPTGAPPDIVALTKRIGIGLLCLWLGSLILWQLLWALPRMLAYRRAARQRQQILHELRGIRRDIVRESTDVVARGDRHHDL